MQTPSCHNTRPRSTPRIATGRPENVHNFSSGQTTAASAVEDSAGLTTPAPSGADGSVSSGFRRPSGASGAPPKSRSVRAIEARVSILLDTREQVCSCLHRVSASHLVFPFTVRDRVPAVIGGDHVAR